MCSHYHVNDVIILFIFLSFCKQITPSTFARIFCTFPHFLWPKSCALKYANRRLETEMAPSVTEIQPTVRSVFLRDDAAAFNTFREILSGSGTEGKRTAEIW